jgi:hypothetical protein
MISRIVAWMKGSSTGLRLPWRMFWIGLAVRVLYITIGHSYHFRALQDHFQFGWEVGRIARALVTGYGYADPFTGHTGPTAWAPPLYPLLLAGVFKLCGIYTPLSAWAILTLNSLFSAAIAPAVYEIATRCYDTTSPNPNRSVALWSGWLWALYPAASQYAVHWVWETSLTTCLFAWTLVIALRVRGIGDQTTPTSSPHAPRKDTTLWAIFAVLWAMIFLSNPTPVLFLPICGLWMLFGRTEKVATNDRVPHPSRLLRWVGTYKFRAALAKATLSALIFLACITPWVYRNAEAFHAFIPSRSNFGAELYQSMLPEHDGFPWGITVSFVENDPEYLSYKALGEIAYVQHKNELAHALIHAHPQRFAAYALKRVYFYWVGVPHPIEQGWNGWFVEIIREMNFCFLSLAGLMGLALSLHRRIPAARLFAWAFLLLPVPYYFITSGARFRHPLEPLICILAVYLFQSTTPRRTTKTNEMRSQ